MAEDERLAETKPYTVAEAQQEYAGCSPREAYRRICSRRRCSPAAAVEAQLSLTEGCWTTVEVMDLSRTYVGPRGALAVVELCRCLPQLHTLSLSDNYIGNEVVWHVVQMAVHHPSIARLDLSRNDGISWTGAMCLVELVLRNGHVTSVHVEGTTIAPDIVAALEAQTRQNAVEEFRHRDGQPCPPLHPNAVYIRSLRTFFRKHQQHGKVSASLLESGFHELLRTSGRTSELPQYSEKFFATLRARAPVGGLTWEAFLLLLLIDGSTFDEATVQRLRQVFVAFRVDAVSGDPCDGGFVVARDLPDMMHRLYGVPSTAADVATMQRRLAVSEEATLQWEEFLFLTYPRGPQQGDRLCGTTCTPLVMPLEVLHY